MNSAVMVMAFSDQLAPGPSARKCAWNMHLAAPTDTRLSSMEDPDLEVADDLCF
jgi:hypothetical protein